MAVTNKLVHDSLYVELEGLSTDERPTEDVAVNSKFDELDTGKKYYFDGEDWVEIGSGT